MNTEKIEQVKFGDILIYSNTKGSATIKQGGDVIVVAQDNIPKAINALVFLSTPVEDKVEVSAAAKEHLRTHYRDGYVDERMSEQENYPHEWDSIMNAFKAGANWALSQKQPTPAPVKECKFIECIKDWQDDNKNGMYKKGMIFFKDEFSTYTHEEDETNYRVSEEFASKHPEHFKINR